MSSIIDVVSAQPSLNSENGAPDRTSLTNDKLVEWLQLTCAALNGPGIALLGEQR